MSNDLLYYIYYEVLKFKLLQGCIAIVEPSIRHNNYDGIQVQQRERKIFFLKTRKKFNCSCNNISLPVYSKNISLAVYSKEIFLHTQTENTFYNISTDFF